MRKGQLPVQQVDFHRDPRKLDAEDMGIMHLPRRYWSVTARDLPPELRLREVIDRFIDDPAAVIQGYDPTLFLFSGPPDTGKTSAAAVMAKVARAHRFTVLFVDVSRLQKMIVTDELTDDGELTFIERAYRTDVLILDGLGRENLKSDFGQAELEALVRHRQDELLLTIITTNLSQDELDRLYTPGFVALLLRTAVGVDCPYLNRMKED